MVVVAVVAVRVVVVVMVLGAFSATARYAAACLRVGPVKSTRLPELLLLLRLHGNMKQGVAAHSSLKNQYHHTRSDKLARTAIARARAMCNYSMIFF